MKPFQRFLLATTFAALLVGAGVGCADNPDLVAPQDTETSTEMAWSPGEGSDTPSYGLFGRLGDLINGLVVTTLEILPGEGGIIESGPYSLVVPPDALKYDAEFSLTYPRSGSPQVNLGPHGAQFAVPVVLEADLSGTHLSRHSDVTLYWWNEEAEEWVDVGGSWDPSSRTYVVELDHFSLYKFGRAGW